MNNNLVMDAMRLAERAHRLNGQFRKAPEGEDRPSYFLHLVEVSWMLQEAGLADEVVAAGYLHDMLEDCGYTRDQLAEEIGNERVTDLVQWVSEPEKRCSWEERNAVYLERMRDASSDVRSLSCADKTSNLRDMVRFIDLGYKLDDFLSRGMDQQLAKFIGLDELYKENVADSIYSRFTTAFERLKE
jgi:(p)ppGpp synthase/HD superfamily hydrolase